MPALGDTTARMSFLFLYYNLGGEMIYILNQRLIAQNICPAKAFQVLNDILQSFFASRDYSMSSFLNSPAKLSLVMFKNIFEGIISSSPLMRLTPPSFDKLYDLMVGVSKYQLVMAPYPSSLYYITHNHMTSLMAFGDGLFPATISALHRHTEEVNVFLGQLSRAEWSAIRSLALTNFFIDVRTRVSILLREGCQDIKTGRFVIPNQMEELAEDEHGFSGRITHYDDHGGGTLETGINEMVDEKTLLGMDIYAKETDDEPSTEPEQSGADQAQGKEAALLATLLGRDKVSATLADFALDFTFDTGSETVDTADVDESAQQSTLRKAFGEMSVDQKLIVPDALDNADDSVDDKTADDLLELMDS